MLIFRCNEPGNGTIKVTIAGFDWYRITNELTEHYLSTMLVSGSEEKPEKIIVVPKRPASVQNASEAKLVGEDNIDRM